MLLFWGFIFLSRMESTALSFASKDSTAVFSDPEISYEDATLIGLGSDLRA